MYGWHRGHACIKLLTGFAPFMQLLTARLLLSLPPLAASCSSMVLMPAFNSASPSS